MQQKRTTPEGAEALTGIYPFEHLKLTDGYPSAEEFEVIQSGDGRGLGVIARRDFSRGSMICRVSGQVVAKRMLHTLQINAESNLYDPHFTGLLLHSCDPNVFLNMKEFELWALKDIKAGEYLMMDYASTEDVLVRQFACSCQAPNCRGWITGAKETINKASAEMRASLDKPVLSLTEA